MRLFESNRPGSQDVSWCPGCGNFSIKKVLMETLEELKLTPENVVIVSGIGQAAKMPHHINANGFHTLHGRAIPIATGVKIANPELTVIAEGGDGDMYAEGGNHFIHGIRRNIDITVIIHNNQIYGLTKGQASPTTMIGMSTPAQPDGVFEEPFNSLAVAISLNASFVARSFSGNSDLTKELLKQAISHKGFSILEIFQPCVSFNKVNTYKWYEENTYILHDHDPENRVEALKTALQSFPFPLGVIYKNHKKHFNENIDNKEPFFKKRVNINKLEELFWNIA
jgi:2-oxoglutarate ferredoxin oxidoreductase subunit beta